MKFKLIILISIFEFLTANANANEELVLHEQGKIISLSKAYLGGDRAGSIDKILVNIGDFVQYNERLITLDCGLEKAKLQASQNACIAETNNYSFIKSQFENKIISKQEYIMGKGLKNKICAELLIAKQEKEKCHVYSPIEGKITKLNVVKGGRFNENSITIINNKHLEIEFYADENNWIEYTIGKIISFRVNALSTIDYEKIVEATIIHKSEEITNNGTFVVRATMPYDRDLFTGMSVDVIGVQNKKIVDDETYEIQ